MNRRDFLQTAGIALFSSSTVGETRSSPNPNMIQWKDIKKEQPTDENRTYLTWTECYDCPLTDTTCKEREHYIHRSLWHKNLKRFIDCHCRRDWSITHWAYFNIPVTSPYYQKFIINNPDPV